MVFLVAEGRLCDVGADGVVQLQVHRAHPVHQQVLQHVQGSADVETVRRRQCPDTVSGWVARPSK